MSKAFSAAYMRGAQDKVFQDKYNYLVALICEQIQVLNALIGNGLVLDDGVLSVGNELSALQLLSDTVGFLRKTGDGLYAIDTNSYLALTGGVLTGIVEADSNVNYTTRQVRNVVLSTEVADVNAMQDGDVWMQYT